MSASSKKQLRREKAQANLTQKQEESAKEMKKTKLYTGLFVAVIVAMLLVVAFVGVKNSGVIERHTTAAQIGSTDISAVELNYYYMDSVMNFVNQNAQIISFIGLDPSKPLDEQKSMAGDDTTWADYFMEEAKNGLHANYALYNKAVAEGHKLTETEQKQLDDTLASLKEIAKSNGMSVSKYLTAIYGFTADEKSYVNNLEVRTLAQSYLTAHQEALEITDEEIAAKDAAAPLEYNAYSYNIYNVNASDYRQGGTKDENGNTTYSDEEIAASVKAAEADAKALVEGKPANAAALDKAIAALEVNKEKKDAASVDYDDKLLAQVPAEIKEWLADDARKDGDVTYVERSTKDENDKTVVTGYYVVMFRSVSDNGFALANVRHILVPFMGGTADANGNKTYSDEEKAAAKKNAEDLLQQWKDGEATEDTFAKLATEKSTDPGSKDNGGLYEDVYPGQMVPTFNDWCFDKARKTGDTGIVETSYGYHVMFYSGDSEMTYRNYLIKNALFTEKMDAWYKETLDSCTVELQNTKYAPTDMILATRMQPQVQ